MTKIYDERMLFSKFIRDRLDGEAMEDSALGVPARPVWWAVTQTPDNKLIAQTNFSDGELLFADVGIELHAPPAVQLDYACNMCTLLNRQIAHDGTWIVGYTHPPSLDNLLRVDPVHFWRRLIKIWIDEEGDPQFTSDCISPFWQLAETDPNSMVQQSEEAWGKWKHLMRDVLAPTEDELKPKAHLFEKGIVV